MVSRVSILWMRQRRDKAGPSNGENDHPHRHIPRDDKGDPIFLILPAADQAKLEQRLAQCRTAWDEGEPLAFADAVSVLKIYRQPPPLWVAEAATMLAMNRRGKREAKRHLEAMQRLTRYIAVRDLKVGIPGHYEPAHAELTWPQAFERAADVLKCSVASVKADYARVRRDLKAGHHGKYYILQHWRFRHNGRPDPRGPATLENIERWLKTKKAGVGDHDQEPEWLQYRASCSILG
jgi:hypothetical protein